jgi:hypothetical protein
MKLIDMAEPSLKSRFQIAMLVYYERGEDRMMAVDGHAIGVAVLDDD